MPDAGSDHHTLGAFMANDLNLPAIADGQADSQWQTSNDGDAALGNALQDFYTVDFTAGNVTLTAAQFRSAMTFIPSNLSATRVLTIPAVKRALFIVHNTDAVDSITVTKGSTTITVAAGELGFLNTDGTTNSLGGTVIAAAAASAIASVSDYRANVAGKTLQTGVVWSAADTVALTDAATIAVDMSTFINATVTLGGNRTLGQPSNTKVGQSGFIRIVQDGTGSRTLAYHADWKFAGGTDPTLSTAASTTDLLFYQVIAANFIYASLVAGVA
jgi:hypothetical protein